MGLPETAKLEMAILQNIKDKIAKNGSINLQDFEASIAQCKREAADSTDEADL